MRCNKDTKFKISGVKKYFTQFVKSNVSLQILPLTSHPIIVMLTIVTIYVIKVIWKILHNLAADDFFFFSPENGRRSYFPSSISITNSRRSNGWR